MNAFHNAAKSYKKSDPEGQHSVELASPAMTSAYTVADRAILI